ncbi:MAG: methylmalonyl-CoA carboxyltransferase [Spirochaetaceae bacterium]|nr:MAG: methylmalonyl-CoA carboxyltransferase [Spirochaetaceae bacterium]
MASNDRSKGIERQHEKGKLTAQERIDLFVDTGSFVETERHVVGRTHDFGLADKIEPGDGVITGSALVDGRQVWLAVQDFTVMGGSLGEMHAQRIANAERMAIRTRTPFIQINDSGGARIQEGVLSLHGYGAIFRENTNASGVIPQISVILGPCAGGAVYSPAITDFVLMVDRISNMYITGPDVIRQVTGEEISHEDLGGASAHCAKSGVAHARFDSEQACFAWVKRLLDILPSHAGGTAPLHDGADDADRETPEIDSIVPVAEQAGYDVRKVVASVCDAGSFLEIHAEYAKNIVVGFARLAGRSVGIMANQPSFLAGALDINASDKAARFVRFCDAFGIPVISFADVPGFLPGVGQEHGGIIRHGAKMLYAIAEATVPKLAIILRKAYGGAFISMASKALGYDRVLALPRAQIAVMGAEGAAAIVYRREITGADDPDGERARRIAEFKERVMDPGVAAGFGYVDEIIEAHRMRPEVIRSLEILASKRESREPRKHGNVPL